MPKRNICIYRTENFTFKSPIVFRVDYYEDLYVVTSEKSPTLFDWGKDFKNCITKISSDIDYILMAENLDMFGNKIKDYLKSNL